MYHQQFTKCYKAVVLLHCALRLAVQCVVIGPVCVFATGGWVVWVCYHDNSKLHASILTKLGL